MLGSPRALQGIRDKAFTGSRPGELYYAEDRVREGTSSCGAPESIPLGAHGAQPTRFWMKEGMCRMKTVYCTKTATY